MGMQPDLERKDEMMPVIGITLGDPAGVGPEITVGALLHDGLPLFRPVIYGGAVFIERGAAALGVKKPRLVPFKHRHVLPAAGEWEWVETGEGDVEGVPYGKVSEVGGREALSAIEAAVRDVMAGKIDALVTAPIHKEAIRAAGCSYPGHTELLAALSGVDRTVMMLAGQRLRVSHVTGHLSLRDALDHLSQDLIIHTIRITNEGVRELGCEAPRLAVAGLNPHAGEDGLFGLEEKTIIRPAIEATKRHGFLVSGPWPADTVFWRALRGEFDAVVCMYHDQGHIPVKLVEFTTAVNVTLGLPFIRTSVDHGTAMDIAGRGVVDVTNMRHAITTAIGLAKKRLAPRAQPGR